jgi:hypothetical protein
VEKWDSLIGGKVKEVIQRVGIMMRKWQHKL